MQSILITGAAGFIGRNLARELTAHGAQVRGIDNFCVPPTGRLTVPVEHRDVRELTAGELDGFDTIIHLAALKSVPGSFHNPVNLTHNLSVDHHILAAHHDSACPRLLMASTCEIYGDQVGYNRETDPFAPRSPYAVGKAASEMLAEVYRAMAPGKQIGIARFFNTYGPDEGADAVVPAFLDAVAEGSPCRIEGDGEQGRDMTYIDDMTAMLRNLLAHPRLPRTVNLGSGRVTRINEIAHHVIDVHGGGRIEHVGERPNEIAAFSADMHQYARLLGAVPMRDVRDGIREAHKLREVLRQS